MWQIQKRSMLCRCSFFMALINSGAADSIANLIKLPCLLGKHGVLCFSPTASWVKMQLNGLMYDTSFELAFSVHKAH